LLRAIRLKLQVAGFLDKINKTLPNQVADFLLRTIRLRLQVAAFLEAVYRIMPKNNLTHFSVELQLHHQRALGVEAYSVKIRPPNLKLRGAYSVLDR
jgi:hypothetical protein